MNVEQFGDGDCHLVFVLGWGNRIRHENVRWLIDQFVDAGYHVHVFELPVVIDSYETEYVQPVREYVSEFDSFRLVGHSTGGLIAAFLDGAETTTYLSPWWGFPAAQRGAVLSAISKLPVSRPIVPSGTADRSAIGELATDEQLADGPDRAAPTFLREAQQAHADRPPIDEGAVVFCTLRDRIVSMRSIGEAVTADQVVLYDGGHELFSSPDREAYLDRILAAIEGGQSNVATDGDRSALGSA